MSVESMLAEGLYLMLIGMGFVAIFLTILVLILNLIEKYIDHDQIDQLTTADEHINRGVLVAVITAAIQKHRQQFRQ